jgi:hypothetical protein
MRIPTIGKEGRLAKTLRTNRRAIAITDCQAGTSSRSTSVRKETANFR